MQRRRIPAVLQPPLRRADRRKALGRKNLGPLADETASGPILVEATNGPLVKSAGAIHRGTLVKKRQPTSSWRPSWRPSWHPSSRPSWLLSWRLSSWPLFVPPFKGNRQDSFRCVDVATRRHHQSVTSGSCRKCRSCVLSSSFRVRIVRLAPSIVCLKARRNSFVRSLRLSRKSLFESCERS